MLNDYSANLSAPGLLTGNSCLPPRLVMIPVFTAAFWLSCHVYIVGTNCMSISCDYFCPFFVTGLQHVHSFMPGCLVQNNVAPFLVEQLVLSTPWLRFSCLLRSMMHVLSTETFIALLSCLCYWFLRMLSCDWFGINGFLPSLFCLFPILGSSIGNILHPLWWFVGTCFLVRSMVELSFL